MHLKNNHKGNDDRPHSHLEVQSIEHGILKVGSGLSTGWILGGSLE